MAFRASLPTPKQQIAPSLYSFRNSTSIQALTKSEALTVRKGRIHPTSIVETDAIHFSSVIRHWRLSNPRSSLSNVEGIVMLNRNWFFGLIALTAALSPYVLTLLTLLKITDTSTLGLSMVASPVAAIAFGILGRKEILAKIAFGLAGLNLALIVAALSIAYYDNREHERLEEEFSRDQIRLREQLEEIKARYRN